MSKLDQLLDIEEWLAFCKENNAPQGLITFLEYTDQQIAEDLNYVDQPEVFDGYDAV